MINRTIEYIGRWLAFVPKSVSIGLVLVFCVGTVSLFAFMGVKKGLK